MPRQLTIFHSILSYKVTEKSLFETDFLGMRDFVKTDME